MRILNLRFMNLNSLAGEWTIDFTHPDFVSDGLFAITGPTGAGKTTILDAICLALYGRTPRLGKITKSTNEVMSRHTGECFSEVTFETHKGTFQCHWGQHRARKKPSGDLQQPRHEIVDAVSNNVLHSKIKDVEEAVVSASGLDFEQLTRSMMLAQGGFAAFLQATPSDRAPILEQITGTEIYGQISVSVHERLKEEDDKLCTLEAHTAGITILEPEREQELKNTLEVKQAEEVSQRAAASATEKALAWLTTIHDLKQQIAVCQTEAQTLQAELTAFQPQREKLTRALRAATLDGPYGQLTEVRRQQRIDQDALQTQTAALPQMVSDRDDQKDRLKQAQATLTTAKNAQTQAIPKIQAVRTLDQRLIDQAKRVDEAKGECAGDTELIRQVSVQQEALQSKRQATKEELAQIQGNLQKTARDEWLVSGLSGVSQQIAGLTHQRTAIAQAAKEEQLAAQTLTQAREQSSVCERQRMADASGLEDVLGQQSKHTTALETLLAGRHIREYRTEKEGLLREIALHDRIMELQDHRAKLEDGIACPLCGAAHHPFAEGNTPQMSGADKKLRALTELIGRAEQLEVLLKEMVVTVAAARHELSVSQERMAIAKNDVKAVSRAAETASSRLKQIQEAYASQKQGVTESLSPLGVVDMPDDAVSGLIHQLQERLEAWQVLSKSKSDAEQRRQETDSLVLQVAERAGALNAGLAKKQQRLAELEMALEDLRSERRDLYGAKNPSVEEASLRDAVGTAERLETVERQRVDQRQQRLAVAQAAISALTEQITRRGNTLEALGAEFVQALVAAEFSDEQVFRSARLLQQERVDLAAIAQALDDRQTNLRAQRADRNARLAAEVAKQLTLETKEDLMPRLTAQQVALSQLQEMMGQIKHQLSENEDAKKRIKGQQAAIDAQRHECRRWKDLHELIGSSDGKKYRNFAQGLTFEVMIRHANVQLQKMTDRYLLVRDTTHPLEINVIDRDQADETRSAKNLSGGESFIASLAMALGLSQMASRNVRVDSLFLDEGFGTLDEDALDMALETLSGLEQEGKLIGIISHVPALKERIGTQIQVDRMSGGRSEVTGPGCDRARNET